MSKRAATWGGFLLGYIPFGLILAALGLVHSDGAQIIASIPVGLLGAMGARAAWEQGLFGQRKEG